jgi:hypothetical protein
MRLAAIGLLGLLPAVVARAEPGRDTNVMAGPVLGLRLGGPAGARGIVGLEGGVGWGPERLNLGFTRRLGKTFGYLELDPWFYVGASLGFGIDSDGEPHPVLGVWEGVPIVYESCRSGWHTTVTLSIGYRYTGVHELYVAPKVGASYDSSLCFH